MRIRFQKFLLPLLLLSSLTGCKSFPPKQQLFIEDFFEPFGCLILHHTIFASAQVKPQVSERAAISALCQYLAQSRGAPLAREDTLMEGGLRARDFWASILANLTTNNVEFVTLDSEAANEGEIKELLARVRTR